MGGGRRAVSIVILMIGELAEFFDLFSFSFFLFFPFFFYGQHCSTQVDDSWAFGLFLLFLGGFFLLEKMHG